MTCHPDRRDYMEDRLTHAQYYEAWSEWIGHRAVERLVLHVAVMERLRASTDPHLNDIPLVLWDQKHRLMQQLVREAMKREGIKKWSWSLGDTVCVLKAEAQRMLRERDRRFDWPGNVEVEHENHQTTVE